MKSEKMAEEKLMEKKTVEASSTTVKTGEKKKLKVAVKKIKITPAKKIVRIMKKKHHPTFRGSFGTRSIRRKRIEKWDKWRHPRGIDNTKRLENREDGSRPKMGYRTPLLIRDLHPLGVKEILINNSKELKKGMQLVRIGRTVGKKKRIEMVKKANELNIKIINPGVY